MPISRIETASLDSALVAPTATALTTASGSAPSYSARAWVNFNGTGTVAIRASGNVSSITDNGTGIYAVNFTTTLPDTNYCVVGTVGPSIVATGGFGLYDQSKTASAATINTFQGGAIADVAQVNVAIFR